MKSLILFLLFTLIECTIFAQNGGYAVKFNGTDGYATATMNTGNTNSTTTLEMWFTQVTSQAGTQYLADFHSISGTNNRRVMPFLNNSIIGIFCAPNTGDDNNAITQSTGVTVTANVWYHIAVTINSSTLKMYVNGKLYVTTSLTDTYSLTGTEVLTIASDYGNTVYANIKADEVRVWSTERTEAEIKANMYKELAGSEAGLQSYYKMSNGSGAALSDNQISGSYGGVLSGGYTWVASGAFADSRNGLDFDGSNDYVDCGNSASVQRNGTQSFTLEAWVKPTGGVWVAVISKFVHSASNEGYSLEIFSDNKVSLLYGNNWSDWNATTSAVTLTSGVWSHIAATYDGTTVKVYINGLLSQSATWTNGITDSGTNLLLGARSGTTFYFGQMDEARVWTVARTQAEIQESMCRALLGNEAGLAAYYRLDQIDGTTTYDLTSNTNNGTLTNMDPSTDWVTSDAFDTWIGAESSSWSDAGNWSKGVTPTSANSVGVYKWALGNEATISTSPTINNLFISSTSSPTLSSSTTINMNLVLGKDFNLNGQTVTLGSVGNLVEGSYRIYGTSGTITTSRTLSNISALDVAGLGAKITTAANMGSTTITRGHAQQSGNDNVSILRYYDITPTNNSSLNATLVFNYKDEEFNSLTENNFTLYKSTDGGTFWIGQGGTLSAVNNTITKTGIASFSRWTIGDVSLPLGGPPDAPVATAATGNTLTSFSANWSASTGATKYYLDVSTNNTFSSFVTGFNDLDVGNVVTYSVTGLSSGTTYYYRVRAYNAGGTSGNSNTITTATTNSAPVLANIEGTELSYIEGDDATAVTSTITVSDVDDTNIESAVISITINYISGEDELIFTNQNGISGTWNATTGTMNLSGTSILANYQSALRNVKYNNTSVNPSEVQRTISIIVNDGTVNSTAVTRAIAVSSVNSTPELAGMETGTLSYTESDSAITITSTLTVNDEDNTNIISASICINGNYKNGEDILSFTNRDGINGIWEATTGTLSLSGTSTLTNYQNALRSIKYLNTSINPSTLQRTVSFSVNDGRDISNTLTRKLNVLSINSDPELTEIETTVQNYVEREPAVQITNTITISDIDDLYFESAVIQIAVNYNSDEDLLNFNNQNGITGNWNVSTGTLSLSGVSTLVNYQNALRNVKYFNTSVNPDTSQRTISFSVNDGKINSNTLERGIRIRPVNGAPTLTNIETTTLNYTENIGQIRITNSIEINDSNSTELNSAIIQITGNYHMGEDELFFADTQIGTNWTPSEGKLTLIGKATIEKYQEALRMIRYQNKSSNPSIGLREISFTVNDGDENSNSVTRGINIIATNNLPEIVENNPISVDEGGTIEIGSTFLYAEDMDNNSDEVIFVITNVPANGKLFKNETAINGNDGITQSEISAGALKYEHDGGESLSDGFNFRLTNFSTTDTTQEYSFSINVKPINDKPVLYPIPELVIKENESGEMNLDEYVEDVDNTKDELIINIASQSGNTTIEKIDSRRYKITPAKNWYGIDSVRVEVSDGNFSVQGKFAVNVTSVNDNPEIVNLPEILEYNEGESAELNLSGKIRDTETPENELTVELSANVDWLKFSYNRDKEIITISSSTGQSGECELYVKVIDTDGGECVDTVKIKVSPISGITMLEGIPTEYSLNQNYPNPFNPTTKIRYSIPKEEAVQLKIYNILGQEVLTLVNQHMEVGTYEMEFDCSNLPSGIYFCWIKSGNFSQIKKMMLIK